MTRPDVFDQINAFRAGYRHGAAYGIVTPREAEVKLRALPTTIPITHDTVTCFCLGAEDGAAQDSFRYLLTFAANWPMASASEGVAS